MKSTIHVTGLEIYGYIGVSEAERQIGHRLKLDLSVEFQLDTNAPDELAQTVDYGELVALTHRIITESKGLTLEFLGQTIIRQILSSFPNVNSATISLKKIAPPIPFIVESVGVTLSSSRNDL